MSCDDLACLQNLLARVPTNLRIAEALFADRLALALLAACALSLACLCVMVGKICWLLYEMWYDDINFNEGQRHYPRHGGGGGRHLSRGQCRA